MNRSSARLLLLIAFTSAPMFASGEIPLRPTDFVEASKLEKDIKVFCLSRPTLDTPMQTNIAESTSRHYRDISFQSLRFSMAKKGVEGPPDCKGEREIVQVIDQKNKRSVLFDSGFYPSPYCSDPDRRVQPPIVFEMREIGSDSSKPPKRKLAVVEIVSVTLRCPDIDEAWTRRFLFFDVEDSYKLLLDVQAEFVAPEFGDEPYRINLIGPQKVFQSAFEIRPDQVASSIELKGKKFSVALMSTNAKKSNAAESKKPIVEQGKGERIRLNEIYSKDQKHVYIETADRSGKIEGADPKTFQLLSTNGESAYTKDAKRVYFFGEPVPKADPGTFIQLNDRHGKDIKNIYLMKSVLSNVDASSFSTPYQSVWYSRDKNHVYNSGQILKLADPETFSTGDDRSCGKGCTYRSEDKNHRYGVDDEVVQKTVSVK